MTFPLFLLIYVLGALAIGIPLGASALLVLRHPKRHPTLARLLFPLTAEGDIGRYGWEDPIQHDHAAFIEESLLVSWRELRRGFDECDFGPIARYLAMNALVWPIRLMWILMWASLRLVDRLLFGKPIDDMSGAR